MRESTKPQAQGTVSLLDGEKARTSSIWLICSTCRSKPTDLQHRCDIRRLDIEGAVIDLELVGEGAEESAEAFVMNLLGDGENEKNYEFHTHEKNGMSF